jgi:predicted alpha/beta-fold hydrolase
MPNIQVPALALNARNDPFVPAYSLPTDAKVSTCVKLWQPPHGGHVGFANGAWPGHLRALPEAVGSWLLQHLN